MHNFLLPQTRVRLKRKAQAADDPQVVMKLNSHASRVLIRTSKVKQLSIQVREAKWLLSVRLECIEKYCWHRFSSAGG